MSWLPGGKYIFRSDRFQRNLREIFAGFRECHGNKIMQQVLGAFLLKDSLFCHCDYDQTYCKFIYLAREKARIQYGEKDLERVDSLMRSPFDLKCTPIVRHTITVGGAVFLFYGIKFFSLTVVKNLIPLPTSVKNQVPFPTTLVTADNQFTNDRASWAWFDGLEHAIT